MHQRIFIDDGAQDGDEVDFFNRGQIFRGIVANEKEFGQKRAKCVKLEKKEEGIKCQKVGWKRIDCFTSIEQKNIQDKPLKITSNFTSTLSWAPLYIVEFGEYVNSISKSYNNKIAWVCKVALVAYVGLVSNVRFQMSP